MVKILPQLFYQTPEIDKILVDGLSCVIHKKLKQAVFHKEGYVSAHAITLVLRGLLKVENDQGMAMHAQENEMIFLPKGLYTVSDIMPNDGEFEAVVFFFDEQVLSSFIEANGIKPIRNKCITAKVMEYTPTLRVFTEALLTLYRDKALANRNLTRLKLTELLHLLSSSPGSTCFVEALATLNNKERRSLKEFMEANFSKPLSIEDYAYLTGRSLSSFRRDFIAQFGISPKQWLIDKRLEKATTLLSINDMNVSQVALEVGYENFSHFIKAYHKKFGISPKQFLMKRRKEVLV